MRTANAQRSSAVTASELAFKLKAKQTGDGKWQARCPVHNDNKPSLSITDDNGKVLVRCHAGCLQHDVWKAVNDICNGNAYKATPVVTRDEDGLVLDIDEIRRRCKLRFPGNSRAIDNVGRRVVARYDYTDEKGALLYQVVRYDPKEFRQRRPGNGGWIWNLQNVCPVPYRLPRVLTAKLVYIVEGEKDVATLEKLGQTATTNSGGAGKWKSEFSAVLRGKNVVIIPDNDETGRRHAGVVARSLHDAGALSVKVVTLPDAKDVTDWVKAGGTREELIGRVKTAAKYQPPAFALKEIRSYEEIPLLADCLAAGAEIDYIEEPIIVAGAVTALTGDAGCGKSTLASAMAFRAHEAGRPVLILDRENPPPVIADRFRRLNITDDATFRIWGGWVGREAPQPGDARVVEWVRNCEPRPLVVIDSMSAFHGGDENSASDTRAFLQQARQLADFGATVIVLHHDGKAATAKDYRGSSDFKAAVDIAFHVSNLSDDGRLSRLTLRCFKSRFGFAGDVIYEYAGGRVQLRGTDARESAAEQRQTELMKLLRGNPGVSASAFAELAVRDGLGRNRSRQFLIDGVRAGWIERKAAGRNNEKQYRARDKATASMPVGRP